MSQKSHEGAAAELEEVPVRYNMSIDNGLDKINRRTSQRSSTSSVIVGRCPVFELLCGISGRMPLVCTE